MRLQNSSDATREPRLPEDQGLLPLVPVAASHGRGLQPALLTYHEITEHVTPDHYKVGRTRLEDHLQGLKTLIDSEPPSRSPRVTFDDGHASQYEFALPLLEKYSLRAVFFITAGWIGRQPESMSWGQIRELVAAGHEVQSHSWSHPPLPLCSEERLHAELHRSRQTLLDHVGTAIDAISVPHGRWDRRVLKACAEAGYRYVYTSDPWMKPGKKEGVETRARLTVRSVMDARELQHLLTLRGAALFRCRAEYQAKQGLKRLLGFRLYHALWRHFVGCGEPGPEETLPG